MTQSATEPAAPAAEAAAADAPDTVEVQDARLAEAPPRRNDRGSGKIDLLLETSVDVSAVLGTIRMPIGELLRMGTGSVLPLNREAGEPVDLLLNGVPFAKGHLVVVENRLGVRLTEVETPGDADADPPAEAANGNGEASDGA
ncbi:MAG: flagellar motor switch protein FliN [Phycisphaerae bacterium]